MSGGSGFLQTKTVVSCNHIHQLSSGSYIFLAAAEGEAQSIYRLSLSDGDSLSVGIDPVAGPLHSRIEDLSTEMQKMQLPASIAEVEGVGSGKSALLIASSGFGDLTVFAPSSDTQSNGCVASAAVTPLKHPPPSLNVRPFIIESAYHTPGHIRCLVSAIKPRSVSSAAACEVFVIVLQYDAAQPAVSDTVMDGTSADSSQLPLFIRVSHVQLLQTSAARPHAVVVAPALDRVLLASEPMAPLPLTDQQGLTRVSTPAESHGVSNQQYNVMESSLFTPASTAASTAAATAAAFHSHFTTAIDPVAALSDRALPGRMIAPGLQVPGLTTEPASDTAANNSAEAAQRSDSEMPLRASITSNMADTDAAQGTEEAVAPSEMDLDLIGDQTESRVMNFEGAVRNLDRFTSDQPAGDLLPEHMAEIDNDAPDDQAALEAMPTVVLTLFAFGVHDEPQVIDSLGCGGHKLLGASSGAVAVDDSASTGVLLGLTDDVDAAVIRIAIATEGSLIADHQSTVPALAYVAAGKVQKRSVLFGTPDSGIAAAIVEAHAYAFLYKKTAPGDTSGANSIQPLGLSQESMGVLGAVLLPGHGHSTLVVLTQDAVHTFLCRWV